MHTYLCVPVECLCVNLCVYYVHMCEHINVHVCVCVWYVVCSVCVCSVDVCVVYNVHVSC